MKTPSSSNNPRINARSRTAWQQQQIPVAVPKQPFTVIYDWAATEHPEVADKLKKAKAERYVLIYQNIDPEAAKTGLADSSKIIADVHARYGANPSGWGMLDYEFPFDEVFHVGPTHELFGKCAKSLIQAFQDVKQAFPNVKWTYYGFPGLSYWPGGKLWAFADKAAQQAEIEKQILGYAPMLEIMDWYSPCVYDVYDLSRMSPQSQASHLINETEYRIARINVIREFWKRNNMTARPILPAVSPFFTGHGNSIGNKVIPKEELIRDQIMPLITSKCDGMAIWSASDWYAKMATLPTNPSNAVQQRIRPIFQDDFFGGVEPNWTDPAVKATLHKGLGNVIADMAVYAQEAAKTL